MPVGARRQSSFLFGRRDRDAVSDVADEYDGDEPTRQMPMIASAVERNEQFAALLLPRSIAIVGASADGNRIGGRPLRYYGAAGYTGPIHPINPHRSSVQGRRAYADIRDVGLPIGLALLAVPNAVVDDSLASCVAAGAKAAVIFQPGSRRPVTREAPSSNGSPPMAARTGSRCSGPIASARSAMQ